MEVLEEEELREMAAQRSEFTQRRDVDLATVQRLATRETVSKQLCAHC